MSIYQKAARVKLRFQASKGNLTVEDLWDLSLKSLDAMAVEIDGRVKSGRKTFLEADTKQTIAEGEDTLRLAILVDVISTRQAETKAAREESARKNQMEFFENLLEQRRTQSLSELSEEEILKRIEELKNPA